MKTKHFLGVTGILATLAITGCGGGGGSSTATVGSAGATGSTTTTVERSSPEGLWNGTARSGNTSYGVSLVILENGQYFGVYSLGNTAAGLLQGSASSANGSFNSTNGRDFLFGFGTPTSYVLSGSYTPRVSLQGVATYTSVSASASFTATYDASYDTPASLAGVAGQWTGTAGSLAGGGSFALSIAANGTFNAITDTGCRLSGSLSPRASGKAVFDATVRYDQATCGTNVSGTGIAGVSRNTLILAAVLPDRGNAVYAVARR